MNRPVAFPHFDIVNRDTSPGMVFDLGVDLVGYDGSVFIKVSDIQEMARSIGMLSAEDAATITNENKRLRAQLDRLPEQAKVLKDDLDRVVADFHSRLANPESADSPVDSERKESPEEDGNSNREPELDGSSDLLDLLKK